MDSLVQTTSAWVITIPGVMRGKQRARVAIRGRFASAYTPKETVNAEAWVKRCAVDQIGSPCLDIPLDIAIQITVQIAESWSNKKRAAALAGEIKPTGKPDLDNCAKLLCDALNGVIWKDDSQIVAMTLIKRYGERPQTVLKIWEAA